MRQRLPRPIRPFGQSYTLLVNFQDFEAKKFGRRD